MSQGTPLINIPWRTITRNRQSRRPNFDFVFENPALSSIWEDELRVNIIDKLRQNNIDFKSNVLSYCKHRNIDEGPLVLQKNTRFVSSLYAVDFQFGLCSKNDCQFRHKPFEWASLAERNSIPESIINQFLIAWIRGKSSSKQLIFVDVFRGHGSIQKTVESFEPRNITYVGNDYNESLHADYCIDIKQQGLERLINTIKRDLDTTDDAQFLLWLSTDCSTYSTMSRAHHQPKNGTVSECARKMDFMNESVIKFLAETNPPSP